MFAIREAVAAARAEEGLTGWFHIDAPATAAAIRLACEDRLTKRVSGPPCPSRFLKKQNKKKTQKNKQTKKNWPLLYRISEAVTLVL